MALDPNIALSVRGPAPMPAFDPMEAMGQAQAFQVRKLAIEKAQRDAAAEARMRQLASQYGDDPDELIKQLGLEFPEQAAEIRKTRAEELHKGAQAKREQALAAKEELAFGMSTMQGVTPENYARRRQIAVQFGKEVADRMLPPEYDAAAIDSALQTTRTAHDYYDGIDKGAQAVLDGKHIKAIGLIFRSAKTPEMWQDATKVAQEAGFGKLAALLGPAPSPEGFARADEWAFGEDEAAKAPKAAAVGSFEDYVLRVASEKGKTPEQLTTKEIEHARKLYQQADDRPRITVNTPRDVTPTAKLNMTRQLRNDYTRETKAASETERQLQIMKSSLAAVRAGKSVAGSQGVLVTFQKILDPISVVRESEYARSAAGLSLLGRLEGKWMQISQGGAGVTVKDLEQFVAVADQWAQGQRAFTAETKQQIDSIAKEYGMKPEHITRDIGERVAPGPGVIDSPTTPPPPAAPAAGKKPDAKGFREKYKY